MATTAKKKPAKKPVIEAKVVTVKPARASTKSVSTKTTVKKDAKVTKISSRSKRERRTLTPLEKVRSIHLSAVFAYVILAVISIFVLSSASSELLLNLQARDTFANADSVILGSASEVLANVQYRYFFIATLALAAIASLLLATNLRKRYEQGLTASISGFRWLLMGIVSAALVDFVSFIGGVTDLSTLIVVAALIIAGSMFGWLSDRENVAAVTSKTVAYYTSVFAYLLALIPLAGSLVGTTVYGNQRFGWHVYALSAVILAGIIGTLLTQRASISNKATKEYIVFEQRYLRINQMVIFLVVLIIFSAFGK